MRPTDKDWLDMLTRSRETSVFLGEFRLPGFPSSEIQVTTVGNDGPAAIREAWQFAIDVTERFKASPLFASPAKTLLDFGCGWGRIARSFFRDFQPKNVLGIDVNKALIEVCHETFSEGRFLAIDPIPPTNIEDASCDFIVGYFVFSHLPEDLCRVWMKEFARILKPRGQAALTTRGRFFFEVAQNMTPDIPYRKLMSGMFADFEEAKGRYDRGEFVFASPYGSKHFGDIHSRGIRAQRDWGRPTVPLRVFFPERVPGAGIRSCF